jgi:hypothetical protein
MRSILHCLWAHAGRGWQRARARGGGGSGEGRRVGKRGGQANSDITIDLQQLNCLPGIAAAHTKGIALQESPALWNRPPLPSILRFARPINLSSERKGRVAI